MSQGPAGASTFPPMIPHPQEEQEEEQVEARPKGLKALFRGIGGGSNKKKSQMLPPPPLAFNRMPSARGSVVAGSSRHSMSRASAAASAVAMADRSVRLKKASVAAPPAPAPASSAAAPKASATAPVVLSIRDPPSVAAAAAAGDAYPVAGGDSDRPSRVNRASSVEEMGTLSDWPQQQPPPPPLPPAPPLPPSLPPPPPPPSPPGAYHDASCASSPRDSHLRRHRKDVRQLGGDEAILAALEAMV